MGKPRSAWHRITNVDQATRQGRCSLCGPVKVRFDRRWRCWEAGRGRGGNKPLRTWIWRAERQRVLVEQGGRCAICRTPLGIDEALYDHEHGTGQRRGVLCKRCNLGLGWFCDDPERLRSAVAYLEKFAAMVADSA